MLWIRSGVLLGWVVFGTISFAQQVELEIRQTAAPEDDYVTWAPSAARIRIKSPQAAPLNVVLTNDSPAAPGVPVGGDVWFADGALTAGTAPPPVNQSTLPLTLPANGDWVSFLIAGWSGRPSKVDKDTVVIAHADTPTGPELGRIALMVRVRKNATRLTIDERDRYLKAIKSLRDNGEYKVFQQVHSIGGAEAHGGPAFIAWHRCFILDYERELQKIDPSVALPYWDFNSPDPMTGMRLFSTRFMGTNAIAPAGNPFSLPAVTVQFFGGSATSPQNPLNGWTTDLNPGTPTPGATALRRRQFDRSQSPIRPGGALLRDDIVVTPNIGEFLGQDTTGSIDFSGIEDDPHGWAHVWGGGSIGSVPTAVEDPLFFMLHCNIDRLWAQWQSLSPDRYTDGPQGYFPQAPRSFPTTNADFHIGHYPEDEMWPWNGATNGDRPPSAPGGAFPVVVGLAPGVKPRPIDTLDFQGRLSSNSNMGYSYDDDPF